MRNNKFTGWNMVVAMLVILVPAALIYQFFSVTPDEPNLVTVDWKPAVAEARTKADYPVLAPQELGDDWKVTKAKFVEKGKAITSKTTAVGNTWLFGVHGPDKFYYEVEQRDADPAGLAREASRTGYADGSSTIGAKTWARMTSPDDRTHCLFDQQGEVGTAVCADTSWESLESFVGKLSAS
ncbi:MAG TPA: DUF4245 domain-containing protein [Candidatus Luteococcus avicola]|nr:DUF4245 domain-containing protein [Candidatus Luteococcus avicola]